MATSDTLKPGYFLHEEVESTGSHISVDVHFVADAPVNVYALSRREFRKFKEGGDDIDCYDLAEGEKEGNLSFTPVANSTWYLVIQNDGNEEVEVSYEIE